MAKSSKSVPRYVDGYVLPVPKKNIEKYRNMSRKAGKVWREHGALEYRESAGDDINVKGIGRFKDIMKLKPGETVVFAWITYKSRAHRDKINKKVMEDPRLKSMMDLKDMPFDIKRMVFGGFKIIVDA
jgi:uncharacterized protein YbaA (DUF1428 family)